MSVAKENNQVQLHEIGMEHLAHAIKMIAERNLVIQSFVNTPPRHLHESNNIHRQVEWYNDHIKKVLGI